MSGKNFAGIVDTAMKEIYLENLKYASKLFADNGITGLIEPISQQAVPNYFMDSFKTGAKNHYCLASLQINLIFYCFIIHSTISSVSFHF